MSSNSHATWKAKKKKMDRDKLASLKSTDSINCCSTPNKCGETSSRSRRAQGPKKPTRVEPSEEHGFTLSGVK